MYQVSIKVKGPWEVSAAEVLHRPAVYHKVVHPSILGGGGGGGGGQHGQVPRLLHTGYRIQSVTYTRLRNSMCCKRSLNSVMGQSVSVF